MNKKNIKEYIIDFSKTKKYFSIDDIKEELNNKAVNFKNDTLKRYCYDLKQNNIIFGAGKGWYSPIKKEFKLDKEPIKKIIKLLQNKFPFLEFSCWSTEQLKNYFHHLPSKFIIIIYAGKDFLQSIQDFLMDKDYNIYLNPYKGEVDKFVELKPKTVILRHFFIPRTSNSQYYASIEKILVDLFMENKKLNLIDLNEYRRIISNIILNYRINIPKTFDYAHERKVEPEVKEVISSLIKSTNATLF